MCRSSCKAMVPIRDQPGLYRTNISVPRPKQLRKFKNELIKNASTPAMVKASDRALKML